MSRSRQNKGDLHPPAGDAPQWARNEPIELVILSVKQSAARCRPLGDHSIVTFRTSDVWRLVPGYIITVMPHKFWHFARHPYLSGEIVSVRLDVASLALEPLRLEDRGLWDPHQPDWAEDDEPQPEWAQKIFARGPRPQFEMEQVLPGAAEDDLADDPIVHAVDLKNSGDWAGAQDVLMQLCEKDLRCLDAHSHLGKFAFDALSPDEAIRHYEVGLRIGQLSLGDTFHGVLSWNWIDNRPFLRCLHGYGLCLWRLGRFDEAEQVFDRLLWLNPADNLGARFNLVAVQSHTLWEIFVAQDV